MARCILGIDPGLSGACAFYSLGEPASMVVYDMPAADGEVSTTVLAELIERHRPTEAIVERVGSMPKQGVASTFKFGLSVGAVHGVLGALKIPYVRETPAKWKRRMSLNADKDKSRAMAMRLFPDAAGQFKRKKDDGRAEAAVLAYYRAHVMNGGSAYEVEA